MPGGVEPSITNSDLNALIAAADIFVDEAHKCAEAGSFHAACVMIVASYEARLLATAGMLETDLRRAGDWPVTHLHAGDVLRWDLETGIQLARRAGWFDGRLPARLLEEAVRVCQTARHACAHPARYVREGSFTFTEDGFVIVYNVLDEAVGVLGDVLSRAADPPFGSA